jgi:cellulose synthase/poly-beta-1,6-N-acetylglucosamine synthase-like glycosyltransferase
MELLRFACLFLIILTTVYALMILWFTIPLFRKKKEHRVPGDVPFISVIIAARNEEKNISACLERILTQDYPAGKFEVIISDDHSTDRTGVLVAGFRSSHPGSMISLLEAGPGDASGKKAAILRAMESSVGELILTTDADTSRNGGWLRSMAGEYVACGVMMVTGPVLFEGRTFFQRIQRLEFMGVMGLTAGSAATGIPLMCNGANLLYAKKAFLETGGFTGNMKFHSGDDQFLLAAFRRKFGRTAVSFAFHREAIVTTPAESTLPGFLNQRMRWVSKSKGYRDTAVIFVGAVTWLLQAAILSALAAGIFHAALIPVAVLCLGLKMSAELPLVIRMALFFRATNELWLYVPAQLFQLIYVPITGVFGLIVPYRWKGRIIRA